MPREISTTLPPVVGTVVSIIRASDLHVHTHDRPVAVVASTAISGEETLGHFVIVEGTIQPGDKVKVLRGETGDPDMPYRLEPLTSIKP